MTSKERVLTALSHKEPDRIPIDIWGSASRICDSLYFQIVKDQGWKELGPKVRSGLSGDYVDERVSLLVGSDFRHTNVGKPDYFKTTFNEKGEKITEWGWGTIELAKTPHVSYNPLAYDDDPAIIKHHTWPLSEDPGRCRGLKEQVELWNNENQFFITATTAVSGMMMDLCPNLRGFDQFFMDLYINEEFAHKLIGKVADVIIELYSSYIKDFGSMLDCVEFASDLGIQDRSFVSPDIFKKFFKEPYRRVFTEIRKTAPNAKIFLHSCGSVRELIPDLIEIGVDILNSLQPTARGMDSRELKKEFGNEIVFHGGIDIQGSLQGTIEQTIAEAKKRIDAFAPGGGYIFSPSNHFVSDIPLENFYALYNTALEYGKYR